MSFCQKVEAILETKAPNPICDACLADYLAVEDHQARRAAKSLARGGHTRRDSGLCAGCCTRRTVSRSGP
jgi:hypothetical protein